MASERKKQPLLTFQRDSSRVHCIVAEKCYCNCAPASFGKAHKFSVTQGLTALRTHSGKRSSPATPPSECSSAVWLLLGWHVGGGNVAHLTPGRADKVNKPTSQFMSVQCRLIQRREKKGAAAEYQVSNMTLQPVRGSGGMRGGGYLLKPQKNNNKDFGGLEGVLNDPC